MGIPFQDKTPKLANSVFVAPGAAVIGDVEIGEFSSIWFNSVVRGDVNFIRIGKRTNIQDLSVVHVTRSEAPTPSPTLIGDDVSVGHRVILHGCTVKNGALIGMGAILMDRVVIGENAIIGAGSLVTEGTQIPAGHLALGSPAKVIRPLKPEEITGLKKLALHYVELAKTYKNQTS
jgi:carbonic anhydrase/acetyltransferase-like protein (isoleucine patch superfamily)